MKLYEEERKVLTIAAISNMFELFDYTLYAVLLIIISKNFFPSSSNELTLLFGSLTFAISFIFAPLGSFLWGWYGDKFGRINMIKLSVMLMSIPSFVIAILPSYNKIGVTASIIVIFCRILQGISASGEVKGVKIFAMEYVGKYHLGKTSGIISSAGGFGVMCAMLFGYIVSLFPEKQDLWRVGFFIGSALAIVGFIIRKNISEALEYSIAKESNIKFFGIFSVISKYRNETFIVFVLGAFLGVFSYTMHAFMNIYLAQNGIEASHGFLFGILALLSTSIASFITGYYVDKAKRYNKSLKLNLLTSIFIFIPAFYMILSKSLIMIIIAFLLLGIFLGINAALCSVVMFKLFTADVRCRTILLGYAFGVAIFGGTTPLTLGYLSHLNPFYPGYALTIFTLISYILYILVMKRHESNIL